MNQLFHNSIIKERGFQKIGELSYELPLEIWWHTRDLVQVSVVVLSPYFLLKATKGYFLKAITEEGEIYSRDLNALQQYLESHFPEIHISFSFFRDVNPSMVLKRIRDRKMRDVGKIDLDLKEKETALENIRSEFNDAKKQLSDAEGFLNLVGDGSSLLSSYLKNRYRQNKREMGDLKLVGRRLEGELLLTRKLLKEYGKKGVSAAFLFSYSSNLQAVCGREDLEDALTSVLKEVRDAHHYEISQRLHGGRLNIFVEEIRHPALAYQIEWAGGVLNPRQLAALGEPFEELRQRVEDHLMVFPGSDIEIDNVVKDERKLFAAKAIQTFLKRLDKLPPTPPVPEIPEEGGWIGHIMLGDEITSSPILYPSKLEHKYISGTTTSGKSNVARVIVENEMILSGTNVLILDRTRQWCGLGKAGNDEKTLIRFDKVGIGREYTRGFDIRIFTPGSNEGLPLPENLESLFTGCSVVCLKGLTDRETCQVARDVLQTAYDYFDQESDKVELLMVFEEASTFLPESASREAKETAREVRALMTRIAREKAKYGCVFLFITQSLSDFRTDAKIVREMIGTRFFLRATDRAEHEYIEQYVSKEAAETAKALRQGEAIIHSPTVSGVKFYVRAPFSAVREVTDEEIARINKRHQSKSMPTGPEIIKRMYEPELTGKEAQALSVIKEHYEKYDAPILTTELDRRLKIQGATRQRLLAHLTERKLVKKVILRGKRGRPSHGILPLV